MYRIYQGEKYRMIIDKSEFISVSFHLNNEEETENILSQIKAQYPQATHYCYAYILGEHGEKKKYSDDGEPSGTAGSPILKVMEFKNLTHVMVVVIRYFGGKKLGANGLIRAYSRMAKEVLERSGRGQEIECRRVSVTFPYAFIGEIDYFISNHPDRISNLDKEFYETVKYCFDITADFEEVFWGKINDLTAGKAKLNRISTFNKIIKLGGKNDQ